MCAGFRSYKELIKHQPKGAAKWYLDWLESHKEAFDKDFKGQCKGACFFDSDHGSSVIILRDYNDSWEYWEVLMHELSHYLDFIGTQVGITDETEARAYLFEHLFHSIRRILQGIDPKPRV